MASRPATDPRSVRLIRMVRLLLLFESAMYSALTPVLPHYARVLHAGKPALGLLAGAYSAGLLPGALLGGWLAARHGVRRTTVAGLAGFGVAIVAFGAGGDIVTLDLLRLAQGVGCGLIWGGGLTWVIAETPPGRRGAALAGAIGASTFGTLIGPLLGILAVSAGTLPVFALTGTVALGLAAWARRHPEPTRPPPAPGPLTRQLLAATRAGGFALGAWLTTLEGLLLGAAGVLIPLRLAHLGAPTWLIGATFLAVAALMSALSPLVGALVDRRGPGATVRVGLALGAPLVAVLALPPNALGLAGLAVIALGVPMTAGMIPAVSLMAAATERAGVALVLATTAVNVTYAVGETVGAPAAARLSQATGDTLPFALIAALMALTLLAARGRRGPAARPAERPAPEPPAARPTPGCATQGACPEPAGSRTGSSPRRSSPS